MRLKDKVCLITGAASGMGYSHAQTMHAQGAQLVLCDVNTQGLDALAEQLTERVTYYRLDVSQRQDWEEVVQKVVEKHQRIDVLVNNAGILRMLDIFNTSVEDFDVQHAVNSRGSFLGCQAVLAQMEKQGAGSIINISSISAVQGMPMTLAYGCSKGSVAALTKGVAVHCREAKKGVRCNAIFPDGVKTPMITGKATATREEIDQIANINENAAARICDVEDISNLVVFLASDESRYINGAEIMVDNAASIMPPPAF